MKNDLIIRTIFIVTISLVLFSSIAFLNETKKKNKGIGTSDCPEFNTSITSQEFSELQQMYNEFLESPRNFSSVNCGYVDIIEQSNQKLRNLEDEKIDKKLNNILGSSPKSIRPEEFDSKKMGVQDIKRGRIPRGLSKTEAFKQRRDYLINKVIK